MNVRSFWLAFAAVVAVLIAISLSVSRPAEEVPSPAPRIDSAPAPRIDSPPRQPETTPSTSLDTPTLVERDEQQIDRRIRTFAEEMGRMWTRDPEKFVMIIDQASRSATASPPVTFLLAIAQAETNGKILEVSEAGAVGLAQATPAAYLQEGLSGRLFITTDYLVGARAYLTKKPLSDADTIASMLLKSFDANSVGRAKRLLDEAIRLRREGFDELELLRPYAPPVFYRRIEEADARNLATLRELRRIINRGDRAQLRVFRDRVRREYRTLKSLQVSSWSAYQRELIRKRDHLLRSHFATDPEIVEQTIAYEASEFLGEHLDERFSATRMAAFLVQHLERKTVEARRIARTEDEVEEMTAALYNGGSHNVKRMLAGLIASLPETDRYRKRVPQTRRLLEASLAASEKPAALDLSPGTYSAR